MDAKQAEAEPVAYRYWNSKWHDWEYTSQRLEFPEVPAGTEMMPLYTAPPAQAHAGWQDLIWLACRDVIFFAQNETSPDGWSAEILCNDVFGYASADCTRLYPLTAARELRSIYEQFSWDGVIAWCAIERNEDPLKERQTTDYHAARAMLAAAPAPGGEGGDD